MGLERILLAMEGEGVGAARPRGPRCFVVALGSEAAVAGRDLLRGLRDAGVSSAGAFDERSMKAQLRMADRAGAAFAAILGERELAQGCVTLRRLSDGSQDQVPLDEVAAWLTEEGAEVS